mgnify:CR=1 FL=1
MLFFRVTAIFLTSILLSSCWEQSEVSSLETPFELSDSVQTATYDEAIEWWAELERHSPYVKLQPVGQSDVGHPIHMAIISADRNFSLDHTQDKNKTVCLINNAIHPGEPDGVDASMLFARSLVTGKDYEKNYKQIVFLIVPFYNVGGAVNRNCCSRANQNGPVSYGFRGNARNLDLNRDFAKADSKNAQTFLELFSSWNPDYYLETHVSNGANYPYTMTHLTSHPDKMSPVLAQYMKTEMIPDLFASMEEKSDAMIPYVNVHGSAPDSGYTSFYDSPRYSTGYTALVNSIGMLTETHMLKPFKQRVASTLRFIESWAGHISSNPERIKQLRSEAETEMLAQEHFVLDWEVDMEQWSPLLFKGYKAYYDTSDATGLPQLYYDEDAPWEREIKYYDHLKPLTFVTAPKGYLVPRSWFEVVDRLGFNHVDMELIEQDSAVDATVYKIDKFETRKSPYEGHYHHYNTRVKSEKKKIGIRANEYFYVSCEQRAKRLIVEMLEPEGPDSYFNWNFFDEILQQKEWFSAYVFDEEASHMLENDSIHEAYKAFVAQNAELKDNAYLKLYYLYQHSDHYESDRHMTYPVFRVE